MAGCEFVLHQAAIPSVPRSVEDPLTSHRANVDATLQVLVAARDAGVVRPGALDRLAELADTGPILERDFGQRAGLDMEKALGAISKGAAQSWQMENRWQNMVNGKFDYGFAVDWMRKDLGIAMAEGKRWKAQMPLVALVDQFYQRVQERGGGRWDTSSLIQPLQKP